VHNEPTNDRVCIIYSITNRCCHGTITINYDRKTDRKTRIAVKTDFDMRMQKRSTELQLN